MQTVLLTAKRLEPCEARNLKIERTARRQLGRRGLS